MTRLTKWPRRKMAAYVDEQRAALATMDPVGPGDRVIVTCAGGDTVERGVAVNGVVPGHDFLIVWIRSNGGEFPFPAQHVRRASLTKEVTQ